MNRAALSEVGGFTPVIDALVEQYEEIITPAVLGQVWRHYQGEYGRCAANLQAIADELHLNISTALWHVENLVRDGYLKDMTPHLRGRPHVYADTGKFRAMFGSKEGQENEGNDSD